MINRIYEQGVRGSQMENGWYRFASPELDSVIVRVERGLYYFDVAMSASIILGCSVQDLKHCYLGEKLKMAMYNKGDVCRLVEGDQAPFVIIEVIQSQDVFSGAKIFAYTGEMRRNLDDPSTVTKRVQAYEGQIALVKRGVTPQGSIVSAPTPAPTVIPTTTEELERVVSDDLDSEDDEDDILDEVLESVEKIGTDLVKSAKSIETLIGEGVKLLQQLLPSQPKQEEKEEADGQE